MSPIERIVYIEHPFPVFFVRGDNDRPIRRYWGECETSHLR